jgi:DNA-binding NarL/FixJ family response regulator
MTIRTGTIRVLIADDHAIVREGVRHVLEDDGFEIVGEAANGREAVELAASRAPDVVVLDLSMPEMTGLDAVPRIRERAPGARVLVLSIHDHDEYVAQSVRAGANGYLRKDSSPAELRRAIRIVHEGGSFFGETVTGSLSQALGGEAGVANAHDRVATLTPREREVLVEIARGATNKEVAAHFKISVRTVESHRETLMKKLQLRGAASIARFAIDAGLLSSSTDA